MRKYFEDEMTRLEASLEQLVQLREMYPSFKQSEMIAGSQTFRDAEWVGIDALISKKQADIERVRTYQLIWRDRFGDDQ